MTLTNPCWMNYAEVGWWADVAQTGVAQYSTMGGSIAVYGYAKNVRAEYTFNQNSTKYIDSTTSCPNY